MFNPLQRQVLLGLVAGIAAGPILAAEIPAPLEISYSDTFEPIDTPEFTPVFSGAIIGPAPDPMGANALVFNTAGNEQLVYDQVLYPTTESGYAARRISLGFQLLTVDLLGSNNAFTVLFDTPEVRNIIFRANGDIAILNRGTGVIGQAIGSFADEQLLTVESNIDLAANRWQIRVNGVELYSDEVLSQGSFGIVGVRFSHGSETATDGDPVSFSFLDDVSLIARDFAALPAPVPAPAAVWALLGGLGLLASRAKR